MSLISQQFYYLYNFQRVLDWIGERYGDVLIDEELSFIKQFSALPQRSRALLVRMIMRKGGLFRATKLRYKEIGCPDVAAEPLLHTGWITRDPLLTIDQLFAISRKAEIVLAFALCSSGKQKKKSELLEDLRHEFVETRSFFHWLAHVDESSTDSISVSAFKPFPESVYEVNVSFLCERLRLMFFGNLYQDWSEFVLSDLGIYRYEQVEFSDSSRGFRSRQDIDNYLHLHRCRERFDDGDDLDEIMPDIPDQPFENKWLEERRNKLIFKIAQQYERCGELHAALEIYRRCSYPDARLRTIRVLEKTNAIAAAFALAEIIFTAAESEAELQAVLRMLPRLRRKLGHEKAAIAKKHVIEELALTLPYPDVPMSVEYVVQSHLSTEQNPSFYVENALINSLFGLLCWPAIFAAVPGAFFHPFHHGPEDLHSPDFVQKRRDIFEACLSQLDTDRYQQTILENFHLKSGIQSPFVYWGALDEALLMTALRCIPAAHLKKYFERILRDISSNCSGFPDLIQFWPDEKRYRMLEVKGPGDRLQDNQIRWINYCMDHAMPVAVCHVQWSEQAR